MSVLGLSPGAGASQRHRAAMNSAALRRLILRKKAGVVASTGQDDGEGNLWKSHRNVGPVSKHVVLEQSAARVGLAKIGQVHDDERVETHLTNGNSPAISILETSTGVPATRASKRGKDGSAGELRSQYVDNMALLWKGTHKYRLGRALEQHLKIDIADTIIFDKGEPKSWLFTSRKTGRLLKKSADKISVQSIIKMLGRNAERRHQVAQINFREAGTLGQNGTGRKNNFSAQHDQFVCVVRSTVDQRSFLRVEFLRAHQLLELFSDQTLGSTVSLQAYAGTPGYANSVYSCRYRLKDNSIAFEFDTHRLTDDKGIGGSKDIGQDNYESEIAKLLPKESAMRHVYIKANEVAIKSKVTKLNAVLEKLVLRIVRFIEATRPSSQIGSLTAEFVCSPHEEEAQPPTLTHISDVQFRKPVHHKHDDLSARSEESNGSDSSFFSSHSLSSPDEMNNDFGDNGKESRLPKSSQRTVSASQSSSKPSFDSLDEKIKHIAKGPAKHVSSESGTAERPSCWGQYCHMAHEGAPKSIKVDPKVVKQQKQQEKEQPKQANKFLNQNDSADQLYKVLLLSVIQAELQQVEVKRRVTARERIQASPAGLSPMKAAEAAAARAKTSSVEAYVGVENEFYVSYIGNRRPVSASEICNSHNLSTWRLYSPARVCEACYHIYQTIDRSRHSFESKEPGSPKGISKQSPASKVSSEIMDLINGKHSSGEKGKSTLLARPFFCNSAQGSGEPCMCSNCIKSKLDTSKYDAAISQQEFRRSEDGPVVLPAQGEYSKSLLDELTCVAHTGYCFCRYCYEFRAGEELPFRPELSNPKTTNIIPAAAPFGRTRRRDATTKLLKEARKTKEAKAIKVIPKKETTNGNPLAQTGQGKASSFKVAPQHKTHRVTALHSKLSTKLDASLSSEVSIEHPPLLSLRRKSYIPQQKKTQ